MNFNEYQTKSKSSLQASIKGNLYYYVLGLCGESGEVAEKVKKMMRDQTIPTSESVAKELGDVLWYVARISEYIGYSLEDVAKLNIKKLENREINGTIVGSGDSR